MRQGDTLSRPGRSLTAWHSMFHLRSRHFDTVVAGMNRGVCKRKYSRRRAPLERSLPQILKCSGTWSRTLNCIIKPTRMAIAQELVSILGCHCAGRDPKNPVIGVCLSRSKSIVSQAHFSRRRPVARIA
jgi:hypothetical protein